jgi:hypothetical protein
LKSFVHNYNLDGVVDIAGKGVHCGPTFNGHGKLDYLDIWSIYAQRTMNEDILSQGMNFIMLSHTDSDIHKLLDASNKAFFYIKTAIDNDSTEGILTERKLDPVFRRR